MTICIHDSFGHRKLISGPNKHDAVPLHLWLNAGPFYLLVCKKWSISNRLVWGEWWILICKYADWSWVGWKCAFVNEQQSFVLLLWPRQTISSVLISTVKVLPETSIWKYSAGQTSNKRDQAGEGFLVEQAHGLFKCFILWLVLLDQGL